MSWQWLNQGESEEGIIKNYNHFGTRKASARPATTDKQRMKVRSMVSPSSFIAIALCLSAANLCANAFTSTPITAFPMSVMVDNRRLSSLHVLSSPSESILMELGQEQQQQDSTVSESEANIPDSDKPSWKDDGFVFGLQGSGLERPQGRTSQIVVEGDSTETKPYQQAMVALTFAGHAWFLSQAFGTMLALAGGNIAVATCQAFALTFLSWVLADFGSGVLHWSVDNYGNGKTPIMGSIIAAFQGHHSAPWTITERAFCNNVHKLCIPFGVPTMAVIQFLAGGPGFASWFFATFCIFEILSQEFHKWSHQLPRETPSWVNWLQKTGLTVGRKPHALHHFAPFEGNYCIISGICNKPLDDLGFFRRIERFIYERNGVEPNAWKLDPELRARTLRGDYSM